ncbi:MAG: DNA gyrase/topoisomerase IV subunit A, partial [Bacteroidia bacterium]|nr:DNA gyrase/topoisomerase IV subunit A [Bacteroidia bacterium]
MAKKKPVNKKASTRKTTKAKAAAKKPAARSKAKSKKQEETVTRFKLGDTVHVDEVYKDWFIDYASYVILERAVPYLEDGIKPVQRRILHAMREVEDGRYNKVANLIGNTMKYHPHGDASIGDALVQLGQKNLLIDTQGNWGNIYTGDNAAASRYIEARLSKFALDVVFNPKTTNWQLSYDGRNKEPITLPVKFPLLLAQGADGIAVGLATKILPHNFVELVKGSISVIKGRKPKLYPDFLTGGIADFSDYNEGLRGGKIKVRANIIARDNKTLVLTEIPYSTTTSSLIDSIISANDKGKIKIKKVEDNTAEKVEILIHLHKDLWGKAEKAKEALFAFTNCEISISPNACVIVDGKPRFMKVSQILAESTELTVQLLKKELEIRLHELNEQWHYLTLERIFIDKKVYRRIETADTWEKVIKTIETGLKPYIKNLKRKVTTEDIVRLTEIKIKRISKYDSNLAGKRLKDLEAKIKETKKNLKNLKDYAIKYFEELLAKYGKGRERKTKSSAIETIDTRKVALSNHKLFVNRSEGFVGKGLKKDEYLFDCSDLDRILAISGEGVLKVSKVSDKIYIGKDIKHVEIFRKTDTNKVYNLIYQDGRGGSCMVKRFTVGGVTLDKEYHLGKGKPGSKVLYLSMNKPNDVLVVDVLLKPKPKLRYNEIEVVFNDYDIKGRSTNGVTLTKHAVHRVKDVQLTDKE